MADQNFRVKRGLEVGIGGTVLTATPLGNVGVGITNPLGTFQVGAAITMYGASGIISATRFDGSINAPGKTYYVATNGSNSNTGNNLNEPYATIKHALSVATFGDTIFVQSGTFTEIFPLTVPDGVTVRGVGLRGTLVQPTNETKQNDGFLLNGDTTVEDLTIGNFFEPGYGFRFAPGKKSTSRSPYIQRVTVLNKGSVTSISDPYGFDTPHSPPTTYKAGRGALIDGSVVDVTTLEPAMLFNECTFITPNNTALEMTNGARTEWVNCFTYFADKGIYAYDGNVGLGSTGYVRIKTSGLTGSTPAANDELYYLESNYQSGTYSQVGTALTITRVGHGLTVGDRIFADFTSGTATDGFYRITEYVGVNTFSVTMAGSATTSGNISYKEALGFGTVRSYTSATGLSSITAKGEGLFELPTSRLGKTVTAYGDAQLSTLQKKIGTASLYLDGTGDYARCEGGSDFAFSGNFTAETWIYPTSVTGSRHLFALGTETTGRYHLSLESGVVTGNFFGSASTTFGGSISTNTWTHIALVRSGSTITAYVNGTALGTTETNSSAIGNTGQLTIGADSSASNVFVGYIDEVRISNTARYTGTFTPSTTQFNSDGSDKLLLHLDGASASTSFIDSSIPAQDIRWVRSGVGIATATKITLADYQQFGAEMRSIGSAVVFGNTGISADGPGVGLRLFAFNFGHIGSGKDFSQDISLVNQADEVVTSNNANVYFVSIDQSGDFRVGEAFYVNQEAGTVNFGGQNFTLNSLSDLNVTDGTNTNTLTPTYLTVGNIQISGNEITSTSGDININPSGNSETNIDGNLNVSGILTASVLQTSALQIGDSSIAIDDTGSNGTIRFNTDNIEALRINNSQNIGIGTTNPTARLDVFGDSRFTGIITALKFDGQLNSGIATISTGIITNLATSGIATIGTASVDLGYVKTGIVTNLTTTGIGTVNTASVDLAYVKTGIVTNLTTSGIATIATASVDLSYVKTGIVTNLTTTGIGTITTASVDLGYVKTGIVTNLTTTGIATINTASVDLAYVKSGIVTNLTTTGIGTINTASVDLAYVKSGIVTNLTTSGIGTINTASIDLAYVNTGIVTNLSTSGIATIATASVDLAYVNSGIVTNLTTTGIGTITTLNATTGNIVTGVITDLSGSTATYTTGNIVTGIVTNLTTSGIGTIATASVDLGYVKTGIVTNLTTTGIASIATGVVTNLITSGIGTINTASIDLAYVKTGIVTNLTTSGIGTIATASVDLGYVKTGIVTNLTTSGIATIATLNATTGNIVTGLVTTISGTTATYTTGNLDTLNATTGNIVTGLVTTISGTTLNYSGIGTITTLNSTNFISGIATATTRLSTGASGVGINITQNTISGPSEVIIDPAGVGDNTGSVRIKGDLYVDGTTTQINSTSLEIADFIVGIASTATTDLLADGAGIKIGPNNTLLYDYTNTALKSSENFNLDVNKVYQINGTEVLSSTQLTVSNINSNGIATITTASVDLAYVKSGIVTNLTTTGIGTINTASVDLAYVNTGIVTNLSTSGIGTISTASVDLAYVNTGIVTNLSTSGIGTINTASIDLAYVKTGIVTNLTTTGIATINTASVDLAYVNTGIVTNLTTSGIASIVTLNATTGNIVTGVITDLSGSTATYTTGNIVTGIVTNLTTTGIGTINTASVDLAYVKTGIVTNLTTSGIGTINTASVNLAYVKTGIVTNLTTSGIGTITTLNATTGNIVTGVITDLSGSTATYTTGNLGTLNATTGNIVTGLVTTISGTTATYTTSNAITGNIVTGIVTNLSTSGIGTIATASIDLAHVKSGIVTNLFTSGIGTIATLDAISANILTGVVTTLSGTTAIYTTSNATTANIVTGIVTNLTTSGIGTIATASVDLGYVKTGIVTNLTTSGIATIATLNATTGNIATGIVTNLTTSGIGTITTLNATTGNIVTGLITSLSGTTANYTTGSITNLTTLGIGTISYLNATTAFIVTGNVLTLYGETITYDTGNIITGIVTNLRTSGIGTISTASIDLGYVKTGIITNLTTSGIGTISTASIDLGYVKTGIITNLTTSGIGSIATLNATTGNIVTGLVTTISGTTLNYSGIGTITTLNSTTSTLGDANAVNLVVTGITTSQSGFVGNLTGTASTASFASTAYNLTDAANIISGTIDTARLSGTYGIDISGNASTASYAVSAGIATYASIAGVSTYSSTAGIATYADISGISTYSSTAGIATYADISGISTYSSTAGIATYATSAGVSTYAISAGIATYATIAGIATYASVAGVSTSVIGGLASITELSVSGVSTLGNTIIGSGSTELIVTGNARVTGILTIGTSSITLDGDSNTITLGTGATISSSGNASFNNGLNVSGLSTFNDHVILGGELRGPANFVIDPAAVGDDTGTVVIKGNLQIDGTTTTVNSTTVTVDDKNIVLASGAANDAAANGGGITIESGDGNKTWNWIDSTDSWTSSEHINVVSGKVYKVNGTEVLSGNTLGSGVVNSSLTSVGTLTDLNVSGVVTSTRFDGHINAGVGTIITLNGTTSNYNTVNGEIGNLVVGIITSLSGTIATYTTGNFATGNINIGIITSLSGTIATYTTGNFVTGNINTGIITSLSGSNLHYSGIATFGSSNGIGTVTIGIGTTALFVDGNARVTGILSIGQGTISIDGIDNQINVGSGVTIHHTNGVQVGGNTLHSAGLTVNNINLAGIITASTFKVSGGTSSQFLKADGTVDSNTYLTTTGSGIDLTGIVTSIVAGTNVTISGSTGQVTINATGGGGGSSQWITVGAGIHTYSNVGIKTDNPIHPLQVGAGNTIVAIDVNGNLGIGTNNPTEKLHILGNALVSGVITATQFKGDGSGLTGVGFALTVGTRTAGVNNNDAVSNVKAIRFAKQPFSVTDLGDGEILINSESSFNPIIIGGDTNNKVQASGEETLNLVAGNGISIVANNTSSPKSLTFVATGVGATQWVTSSSGIHTLSSVGIGTTNPTEKLTVDGNVLITGVTTIGNITLSKRLTSPNSVTPVGIVSITDSAYSNIDIALMAKGSGATLAQIPDSTTAGGDKRGSYATDLQKSRTSSSYVASGNYSVIVGGSSNFARSDYSFVGGGQNNISQTNTYATIVGGSNNTASGQYSFIGAGSNNTASGQYSFIGGGYSNTANAEYSFISGGARGTSRSIQGYHVFPACNAPIVDSNGRTQAALLLLGRETADATPTVLTSNSSAPSTTNQVILANNSAYFFKGSCIAGVTGAGNTKAWEFKGAIKRGANAASTSIVGSVIKDVIASDSGASDWDITITSDTTNGGIQVQVTGQASTTIRWVCKIETTEMAF